MVRRFQQIRRLCVLRNRVPSDTKTKRFQRNVLRFFRGKRVGCLPVLEFGSNRSIYIEAKSTALRFRKTRERQPHPGLSFLRKTRGLRFLPSNFPKKNHHAAKKYCPQVSLKNRLRFGALFLTLRRQQTPTLLIFRYSDKAAPPAHSYGRETMKQRRRLGRAAWPTGPQERQGPQAKPGW